RAHAVRLSPGPPTGQNGPVAQRRLQIWPRDARDAEQGRAAEGEAQRLRGEVSALRRIALVVARAGSESELLDSIAGEIAQLLGTEDVRIFRYEADREAVVVAARGDEDHAALGSRHRLGGTNATSAVFRRRRRARSRRPPAGSGCGRSSRRRSWSRGGCGARSRSVRGASIACPPTPRRGWRSSPS